MIEKLPENKDKVFKTETGEYLTIPELSIPKPVSDKINELVDVVNGLQESMDLVQSTLVAEPEKCEIPVDQFAEQHKWIGKICKFWNEEDSPDDVMYGELVNIFDLHKKDCPFQCGYGEWYEYCEPVKPDSELIYHGE